MATSEETFGSEFGAERMWGLQELGPPVTPPMFPPAPGWYIVAVLVLIAVLYLAYRLHRRHRANRYRRTAIAEIARMRTKHSNLPQLPALLRCTALIAFPRAEVAGLRGNAWIAWLNGSAGENVFADSDADLLDGLVYARTPTLPSDEQAANLLDAAESWVRGHRAHVRKRHGHLAFAAAAATDVLACYQTLKTGAKPSARLFLSAWLW